MIIWRVVAGTPRSGCVNHLHEQDRQAEAEKNLLARRIEQEVPARHERAVQLSGEGCFGEALRELENILELQPNDARTLLNMGRLYEALGNEAEARRYFESAVAALERAAAQLPQSPEPHQWLAGVYRELGRTRDAERARRRAKALSAPPLDPDAAEGQP